MKEAANIKNQNQKAMANEDIYDIESLETRTVISNVWVPRFRSMIYCIVAIGIMTIGPICVFEQRANDFVQQKNPTARISLAEEKCPQFVVGQQMSSCSEHRGSRINCYDAVDPHPVKGVLTGEEVDTKCKYNAESDQKEQLCDKQSISLRPTRDKKPVDPIKSTLTFHQRRW